VESSKKTKNTDMVILVTGKPGAGKTHYVREYVLEKMKDGKTSIIGIDGDEFRKETNNHDFSDEGRIKNLRSAAIKASQLEEEGVLVICSFVAPRKKWRNMMREYWNESLVVYIPGGTLWPGTSYEIPDMEELTVWRQ